MKESVIKENPNRKIIEEIFEKGYISACTRDRLFQTKDITRDPIFTELVIGLKIDDHKYAKILSYIIENNLDNTEFYNSVFNTNTFGEAKHKYSPICMVRKINRYTKQKDTIIA